MAWAWCSATRLGGHSLTNSEGAGEQPAEHASKLSCTNAMACMTVSALHGGGGLEQAVQVSV